MNGVRLVNNPVRLGVTFFICWITLPADLKNWDFKNTRKLLIFGVVRNHKENNYFETSLSFGKQCKNYDKWGPCLFFTISDLKKSVDVT